VNEPATREDLERVSDKLSRDLTHATQDIRVFVLERETALVWRVITLQLAVVGGIAAAQFGLIYFILTHWRP
jgi:hypothetical protein